MLIKVLLGIAAACIWFGASTHTILAPLHIMTPAVSQYQMDRQYQTTNAMVRIAIMSAPYNDRVDTITLLAMCDTEDTQRLEQGFNRHGAIGPCQIKAATYWLAIRKGLCTGVPWKASDNYRCAAQILISRVVACGGLSAGIASYNIGTSTCPKYKKSKHVRKVLALEMKRRFAYNNQRSN